MPEIQEDRAVCGVVSLTLDRHSLARSACGGQAPTSARRAHSNTIPVVSNSPSVVAHTRPDGARLLVTTAGVVAARLFVWFIGLWCNAMMWSRFAHSVQLMDQARSPDHIVVPVQKSERTAPCEGHVSERLETGTWHCRYRFTSYGLGVYDGEASI